MGKIIFFFLIVLLFSSTLFFGAGSNEGIKGAEVMLQSAELPICLSFENYKMKDGWTPVVVSLGEFDCLLWMDEDGKVSELRETGAHFVEPIFVIDVPTHRLQKDGTTLDFNVYEQNSIRTRWRLSPGGIPGTKTNKILFREGGIDLNLGDLRLILNHVTWDAQEFSPRLFRVQFHGPTVATHAAQQSLVCEKDKGIIYSTHDWNNKVLPGRSRIGDMKPTGAVPGAIPNLERTALIALYNSTNGDYWTNNSGWKTGGVFAAPGTENTWYGITCDPDNATVKKINLANNNLNGVLPQELGNLANLLVLDLNANLLTDIIRPELGNLANLLVLDLSSNQLTESIPSQLENLTNLLVLDLSSNQLSGTIPSQLENLANLLALDLNANLLTDIIPPELGNLANLQSLSLASNQLIGIIPKELGKLAKLGDIDLSHNQLTGIIPPELGNLESLYTLMFHTNRLSGKIHKKLGNLANLEYLNLAQNQLDGRIPLEFEKLKSLYYLDLSSNHLDGRIPLVLGSLANLKYLYLHDNKLKGSIPEILGNLTKLECIRISSNKLRGSIPSNLSINWLNLWYDCSDFRWNALYTNDATLRIFLNSRQIWGNWEDTQTIAPTNVTASTVSSSSIVLNWTPISYTADNGGYQVYYSTTHGGPYTYFGMTADKTADSLNVTGLNPCCTYYFVVRTRTNPHIFNQNVVNSEISIEVSAPTSCPCSLISPNGGELWRFGTAQNIAWTALGLTGNLRIELWKANKKFSTIITKIHIAKGNYTWTIGKNAVEPIPVGNDYKVKIITADGLYNDTSNGSFSIVK